MARSKNQKGYWNDDPFLSYIKGYTRYEETGRDAMQFTIELRGLEFLFPYSMNSNDYFVITHSGSKISKVLNEHFLIRRRSYEQIYGNMHDITGWFGSILKESATYGDQYYAIDWSTPKNKKELVLVNGFTYLHASTMNIEHNLGGVITGYRQKFSRLAYLDKTYGQEKMVRVFNFEPDEIFHIKYPLCDIPPVKQSLGLLKKSQSYWKFTLDRARSGGSKVGMGIRAEMASYVDYVAEQRIFSFIRAKIGKNFHQFDAIREIPRTNYYDAYILCRYMKDKIIARQFLVDQFNKQVFIPLAKRNNIKKPPILEMKGLTTEAEINDLMDAVNQNLIDHNEFIELFNTFK